MSFSKNRNRQKRIKDSGPTIADINGLTEKIDEHVFINPDFAVEEMFDYIARTSSNFRFKKPLGSDFETASESALSCLHNSNEPHPKPFLIKNWIEDALRCLQVICLVCLRDLKHKEIKVSKVSQLSERLVFKECQKLDEIPLQETGSILEEVYSERNNFTHRQKPDVDGKLKIQKIGNKEKIKKFNKNRALLSRCCEVFLSEFKSKFPQFNVSDF